MISKYPLLGTREYTKPTSNSHVSEEEPASNETLLGVTWGLGHDLEVQRVESQGGGRESVSDQVDPQQLDRDQGFRDTQGSCQEDAAQRNKRN